MTALWLVVSLLAIWPFSSGKVYHMTAASVVPAASGTVHVQKDKDNGNMKLDIKVHNLAHPSTLIPSESGLTLLAQREIFGVRSLQCAR